MLLKLEFLNSWEIPLISGKHVLLKRLSAVVKDLFVDRRVATLLKFGLNYGFTF